MKKIVDITHDLIKNLKNEHMLAVDFTMGQGNDTLFLAMQSNIDQVYAYDIQQEAYDSTYQKLKDANVFDKCQLFLKGHETMDEDIDAYDVGIFNFGYLPQGEKVVTTLLDTSKVAVEKALRYLRKKGLLILVIYPGHEEGHKESDYFSPWCKTLDPHYFNVLKIRLENHQSAPYIIAIERIRKEI